MARVAISRAQTTRLLISRGFAQTTPKDVMNFERKVVPTEVGRVFLHGDATWTAYRGDGSHEVGRGIGRDELEALL